MATIVKVTHAALAEKKDPRVEIQKFLMMYRSTPHSSTGKSPSMLLQNKEMRLKLPSIIKTPKAEHHKEARKKHKEEKEKQKEYADKHRRAKKKEVKVGDKVLLKQDKSTTKPPWNPDPMEVKEVKGTKVTAQRGEFKRTRNIEKFKILKHYQPSAHLKEARTRQGEETDEEDDWLDGFKGKKGEEEQEEVPGDLGEGEEPAEDTAGAEAGLQEQARPESNTSSPPLHLRGSADQAQQGGPQHQVNTEFGLIDANSTFLMTTPGRPAEIPVEDIELQLGNQGLPVMREQEDQEEGQARYQPDRPKRKRTVTRKYPAGEGPQHLSKKHRDEEEDMEKEREADKEEELEAETQSKVERDSPENSLEGSRSDLGWLLEQPRAATTPTPTPTLTPQAGAAAQASSVGALTSGNGRELLVTRTNRDPRMLDRNTRERLMISTLPMLKLVDSTWEGLDEPEQMEEQRLGGATREEEGSNS